MKQLQVVKEEAGQVMMVSYLVPDSWEPSATWPVVATMVMPVVEGTVEDVLRFAESQDALVEVDGKIQPLGPEDAP